LTIIKELVEQQNPNNDRNRNYTVNFFQSQWQDQKRLGLVEEDEEVASKKEKLAKFLTDEVVLREYR
jgi:hypothetical protein